MSLEDQLSPIEEKELRIYENERVSNQIESEGTKGTRLLRSKGSRFKYVTFNYSNFNIHYWSWNYRDCWPIFQYVN